MIEVDRSVPGLGVLDILPANGVPFRVLLILDPEKGPSRSRGRDQRWGPTVEFHDRRYAREDNNYDPAYSAHGQYVGSYYADTLLDHEAAYGLNLDGGVDAWSIDAETLAEVMGWLRASLAAENRP
jgi:hypothetical protein